MLLLRRNAPSSLPVAELHAIIDPIDDYNLKIYRAAVWYAAKGIMIVPFTPLGYPNGLSQRHATCNRNKIDEWWHPVSGSHPGSSIAMAHGGQSGFCAVDLDTKKADGIKNLVDLQTVYGDYNDAEGEGLSTLMAITPSGGRHLIFKFHPEIISNSEVAYPGIDTRGGCKKNPLENGGITFIEPSKKPNSEGYYRWDENITEIKDIPQWLVDVLNNRTPASKTKVQLQDSYVQSAPGMHGDGRDRNIYMDLMRFAGAGYTEEQLWLLAPDILSRMDPPDEDMVRRKIESVINSDVFSKAKEEKSTKVAINGMALLLDKHGKVIKCVENLELILSSTIFQFEYGTIEYDDFTQGFTINRKPLASVVDWSIGIQSWIAKKFKVDFPKTDVRDRVEFIAYNNPHINIARDYMLSCPSHGAYSENFWGSGRRGPGPAFEMLCSQVLDLDNPNLHPNYTADVKDAYKGFLWFWLQGVVARACVPGCKMEIVLNIFGSQGIGKSLFFRELCPDPAWFTDSLQDSIVSGGQNNRDELMKLHAKIIVEMPELNPVKRGGKSADDKLKQFISAQVDNMRRPYGYDSVDYPRTCALAGTSNNRDVYRDSTGARRFVSIDHGNWPIRVGDQNNGIMDKIRDSLWGEVVSSFSKEDLSPSSYKLLVAIPPDLRTAQNLINGHHKFEEIGIQDIIDWMANKSRITWEEITAQSKVVPGLRDAKESMIITLVRKELANSADFEFKKRCIRYNAENKREKANFWLNKTLPVEKDIMLGSTVPPHWSTYTDVVEEFAEF